MKAEPPKCCLMAQNARDRRVLQKVRRRKHERIPDQREQESRHPFGSNSRRLQLPEAISKGVKVIVDDKAKFTELSQSNDIKAELQIA